MKTPKKQPRRSAGESAEKSRRKRSEMQPPFRPRDLLTTDRFISYCADRGVRTNGEQLELYDKLNLIIPAVRIDRGYVPYRRVLIPHDGRLQWCEIYGDDLAGYTPKPKKVDPKTYYGFGSISCRAPDWLARYETEGRVLYPARQHFRPWPKDPLARRNDLPTSRKELGEGYMDFHARNQCFALKEAQERMVVEVRDAALFMDDEDWLATGRKLRTFFKGTLPYGQDAVLEVYRVMSLMNRVQDVADELRVEARAALNAGMEGWKPPGDDDDDAKSRADERKEANRDARAFIQFFEQEAASATLRDAMAESGFSIDDVRKARRWAADQASELDDTHRWIEFTGQVPSEVLQQARGDYALALEYYRVANELEWVLEVLGDTPPTLRELLIGRDKQSHCLICGSRFQRKRRNQVTCANPDCIRTNGNNLKRLARQRS